MAGFNFKETSTPGRRFIRYLLYSITCGVLLLALLFFYISRVLLPDTQELENPNYEIASQFISSDGKVLGKVFKYNREWLNYEDINPLIIDALIATEDERFYNHSGIDFRGTARAVFFLGKKGGASTITQQLAKLFFTERSPSFPKRIWQKLKEWVIAVEFEKRYTKEEILAMYLNKSDFLYDAVGIGAASKTYFGKDQKKLQVEEAAVLIGMLKNPRLFNPRIYPQNCQLRRSVVLKQMVRNDFLTEEEYLNKRLKPITLENFKREVHYDGMAPYFRAELVKWLKNLLEKDEYRKPDGSIYNPYVDGLRIYTTIDSRIQQNAEQSMREHMSQLQQRYFDRWQGRDFVTYGASDEEAKARKKVLIQLMKETDRYKQIRAYYMADLFTEMADELDGLTVSDDEIFRMFEEDKEQGYMSDLLEKGQITEASYDRCVTVMQSSFWSPLKKQWNRMQSAVNSSFNTKVAMKVFAYNDTGEKTVVMSPMDSLRYHLQHLQIGSVVTDPRNGNILAWVGGIGHKYFQYDHVNSNRQVGSTIKPFIYTTAIVESAMSPCQKVEDIKHCIEANDPNFTLAQTWCPDNADGKYSGQSITLRQALKESKNSISVYLMKEIGNVESVRNLMENLGIDRNKVPEYPSICLGTPELSALEMAGAYSAFANGGVMSKPVFVTRIEDKDGKVIYTAVPEQKKAINPSFNYVMVDMLKYVASIIQPRFQSEVAGKTGTTNDHKDGWFVGFTPEILISTWVGGDQEFIRFTSLADGQGAVMARPFFEKLLTRIEADNRLGFGKNPIFMAPEKEDLIETDCSKYETALPPTTEEEGNTSPFDEEF